MLTNDAIKKVHLVASSKGGVGKSLIASFLANFYTGTCLPLINMDVDPTVTTFRSYPAFNVSSFNLLDNNTINDREFDKMMESIIQEDKNFVVDTGSSGFVQIFEYFIANGVPEMIDEAGKELFFHFPVAGGAMLKDSRNAIEMAIPQLDDSVKIVIWKNEFWGPLVENGKAFEEWDVSKRYWDRFHAMVTLHARSHNTFGEDIKQLQARRLSIEEALSSDDFLLMPKKRIKIVRDDIYYQLSLFLPTGKLIIKAPKQNQPSAAE